MSHEQGAGGFAPSAHPASIDPAMSPVGLLRRLLVLLDAIGAILSRLLILIGAVALAVLVPLSGWLVFGRYVLNDTPTWVEPLSLLLLVIITFPVAAAGIRAESHLSIDFIRDVLPGAVARAFKIVCYTVLAVFGAVMTMSALTLVEFGWANTIPLIGLPDGVRQIPLAVCGVGTCLFSVVHLLRLLLAPLAQREESATSSAGSERC